ncbi:FYVE zinc finger protein [Pleurostoma richardsiae]|uniref:RING-type E3 ubiquitin transferase n=1 Tax=Pleurostoma richardsiae TaxID=41990 RepID=A0AA38S2C8_9PEZI|nr:FYVE zinc finger protein [Pleurostoma richardsiae]
MATRNGRGSRLYRDPDSDTDSRSSLESGTASSGSDSVCRYRTDRFYDHECSRYFDCPTHIVERRLSEDDTPERGRSRNSDDASPASESDDADGQSASTPSDGPAQPSPPVPVGSTSQNPIVLGQDPEDNNPAPVPASAASTSDTGPAASASEIVDLTSSPTIPTRLQPVSLSGPSRPSVSEGSSNRAVPTLSSTPANAQVSRPGPPPSPRRPTPPPPPAAVRRRTSTNPAPARFDREDAGGRRGPPELVLPRWQPDAEVTICPICRTQFSIFVRKHHCRKCGRVVCASCSPHRITIPYQYIVQPPGEGGYADFSSIGGGERVRLCNPCVPDPNTTPPQAQASTGQRGHSRSQSTAGGFGSPTAVPPSRFSAYLGSTPNDAYARNRSVTLHAGEGSSSARPASGNRPYQPSTQNRILAGTPPTYYPYASGSSSSANAPRYRSMLDVGSSSSRPLPPAPPQIAEEDECPVCHRELPPRSLPNYEALRETHITACINSHSAYGSTPTHGDAGRGSGASPPPRRTGMFPYIATEKDCIDSAECTICLEEFEVGVPMARLECLCRFHRACISAWFVNHPGRCPVHQHDSYGY